MRHLFRLITFVVENEKFIASQIAWFAVSLI